MVRSGSGLYDRLLADRRATFRGNDENKDSLPRNKAQQKGWVAYSALTKSSVSNSDEKGTKTAETNIG
ncbi:Uncharacterised protein g4070 [Pycnogonum litorale]